MEHMSLPREARELIALSIRPLDLTPICWSGAIASDPTWCLQHFALCGDTAGVTRCIREKSCTPAAEDSFALGIAARVGYTDCVRLLLPLSDPLDLNSAALRVASRFGHTDCVELLIPVSDTRLDKSAALRYAAANGHAECVQRLIPVSDPLVHGSNALRLAVQCGHIECVKLLEPVSDPEVVAVLRAEHPESFVR